MLLWVMSGGRKNKKITSSIKSSLPLSLDVLNKNKIVEQTKKGENENETKRKITVIRKDTVFAHPYTSSE